MLAVQSALTLRVLVYRSDGALACLAGETVCGNVYSNSPRLLDWALHWWSEDADIPFYAVEQNHPSYAIAVHWVVKLLGVSEDSAAPFAACELSFVPDDGEDVLIGEDHLLSGLSTVKWVAPVGSTTRAATARARQAAADAGELGADSDDGDSDEE